MKVFIACGAGASSTFLALKMRSLLSDQQSDITFIPAALNQVQAEKNDVVLVASHIANDPLVADLVNKGIPVIKVQEGIASGFSAENALQLILNLLDKQ